MSIFSWLTLDISFWLVRPSRWVQIRNIITFSGHICLSNHYFFKRDISLLNSLYDLCSIRRKILTYALLISRCLFLILCTNRIWIMTGISLFHHLSLRIIIPFMKKKKKNIWIFFFSGIFILCICNTGYLCSFQRWPRNEASLLYCHSWVCMRIICHRDTTLISSEDLVGIFNILQPSIHHCSICVVT